MIEHWTHKAAGAAGLGDVLVQSIRRIYPKHPNNNLRDCKVRAQHTGTPVYSRCCTLFLS